MKWGRTECERLDVEDRRLGARFRLNEEGICETPFGV
jgi:hypothetical protein